MSEVEEVELPDSIKNCKPCQEELITGSLISVCKISKELQAEVNCEEIAQKIKSGDMTRRDAIVLIGAKAKNTSAESTVEKILHILDTNTNTNTNKQ